MSSAGNVIRPPGNGSGGRGAWLVFLAVALVLGSGCAGRNSGVGYGHEFAQGVRPPSGDTARVLQNAHYFKLMGQPAMALKELEEAHRQNPGDIKVSNALGQYYDELGMGRRAQKLYQEALALEPDNPVLHNNLCYSYYLAGNWRQAETGYRQLLARQPQNQAARNNLGLLLCRQGRGEEAKRLWQETEGKAEADQKLREVLAALGRTGETLYARQTRATAAGQAAAPPASKHLAKATATVGPPPPRSSPPAHQTALPPESPASDATAAGAPAKLVAVPRPGPEPSHPSRKVPVPMPLADRLAAAKPVSAVTQPEPPVPTRPAGSAIPRAGTAALASAASPASPPATPKVKQAAESKPAASQAGPPGPPGPQQVGPAPSPGKVRAARAKPLTAKELMETNIAVINGNGAPDLARRTRSSLSLEGFNVVAIANYLDFGVDRTVIYYRPDSERVAAVLHHKFFPGAAIEPNLRLAANIDVKVILGRDLLWPKQVAAPATDRNRVD
jgi:Flp pilus assembly protein TadD